MKFLDLIRGKKMDGVKEEGSIWNPISKEELIHLFSSPLNHDEILVVNQEYQPVFYLRTFYYASGWEYYELGRSVTVFSDNGKMKIFLENAKNVGDYRYEDISFGKEADVLDYIEQITGDTYEVKVCDFEDYVNKNHKKSWCHNGMTLQSGEKILIKRYIRDDGAEFPDISGHDATVLYHFQDDRPIMSLKANVTDCRLFQDGIHILTLVGETKALPLTNRCSIDKI